MYAEGYLCFSTLEKWPSQAVARCVWAVLSPSISRGPGTPPSPSRFWSVFVDFSSSRCWIIVFLPLVSARILAGGLALAWCGLIAFALCCPWYFSIHSTLSLKAGVWSDRKLQCGNREVWKDVGRPPTTWYERKKLACVWILHTHVLVMHKISLEKICKNLVAFV